MIPKAKVTIFPAQLTDSSRLTVMPTIGQWILEIKRRLSLMGFFVLHLNQKKIQTGMTMGGTPFTMNPPLA
jgi:hypothetical protein